MNTLPRTAALGGSCALVLLSLLTSACGGSATKTGSVGGAGGTASGGAAGTTTGGTTASGGTGATSGDTCASTDDCAWGEIDREILKASDCMCLYGCPYLPQTKQTAARRLQQYGALCNPNKDGSGMSCGVDDCALPGAIACVSGTCKAAPGDAGPTQ
jgi:hypothetical protein